MQEVIIDDEPFESVFDIMQCQQYPCIKVIYGERALGEDDQYLQNVIIKVKLCRIHWEICHE